MFVQMIHQIPHFLFRVYWGKRFARATCKLRTGWVAMCAAKPNLPVFVEEYFAFVPYTQPLLGPFHARIRAFYLLKAARRVLLSRAF